MAMIICPECGKEISDKSIYCVHCGAPIFVCPECGKVSTGAERACPNCGYTEKRPEPVAVSVEAQKVESETLLDLWKRENPQDTKRRSIISTIGSVFSILIVILCFVAYFCVLKPWFKGVSFANVVNYRKSITYIWLIAACIVLCLLVDLLTSICDDNITKCAKWLRAKGFDVDAAFQKDMPTLFPNGLDGKMPSTPMHAVYYVYFSNNKKRLMKVINKVFDFVAFTWLDIALAVSLCDHIKKVVGGGSLTFNFDMAIFLPCFIFVLLDGVFTLIYILISKRPPEKLLRAKAWELNASKKVG